MQFPAPPSWAREFTSVGVTGTNGKTTTTLQIASILGRDAFRATTVGYFIGDREVRTEHTYDGFIAAVEEAHRVGSRHAVLECTSEALARGFANAWPCSVAVFTNLSHDHLDAHPSPEHYLASKAQLFAALPHGGVAVLNADDPSSALLAQVLPKGVRTLAYAARSTDASRAFAEEFGAISVVASDIRVTKQGTLAQLHFATPMNEARAELAIRGIGTHFIENALAALLAAHAIGTFIPDAIRALSDAPVPPGRFDMLEDRVVVDYAHTPDAIERTVETARALSAHVTVVLGAGGDRDKAKRAPMGIAASTADRVIITTDNARSEDPRAIAKQIEVGVRMQNGRRPETILDRKTAIRRAIVEAPVGGIVLLLGKGHEVLPFSDAIFAKEVLAGQNIE
jgi:UDP-N-acetylmuramoyl-L-alanyl-D-glutamate--2,6-diaminopimelate ligase